MRKSSDDEINHEIPINLRRKTGTFFTGDNLSEYVSNIILDQVKPDFILEPFVGGGSLITPFLQKGITFSVNDINVDSISELKKVIKDEEIIFNNKDFNSIQIKEIFEHLKIPWDLNQEVLIYTNPPFGTVSTNKLVTKKNELKSFESRNIDINYFELDQKYGRGDLILPSLGKMIEVIKARGKGYIAFYSPFGIFCERRRYKKLLRRLLFDFQFIFGEVFSGENFHQVSKKKPIAFSLWNYNPGIDSKLKNIKFIFKDLTLNFKRTLLLKDGWKYDTRKVVRNEISVQGNDRFNAPVPKIFHMKVKKGGSELIPENVKLPLSLKNIPDELFYGLWSIVVGNRAIINHPLYLDNAHTHLPDLNNPITIEILAYTLIYAIFSEKKYNYCDGRIGFDDKQNNFQFGGENLTKGAEYILTEYSHLQIGNSTLKEIFDKLKIDKDNEEISIRRHIKDEIISRLNKIGYWNFIPIPIKK